MGKIGLMDKGSDQLNARSSVAGTDRLPIYTSLGTEPELAPVDLIVASATGLLDNNNTWTGANDFTGGLSISGVGIDATAKEINDNCDASTRVVASVDPATLAITAALHAEKVIYLTDQDGAALTLPAATGTGNRYMVCLAAPVTSNTTTIKAASVSDSFLGNCNGTDDDADAPYSWKAETADDTITLDGTTTGGKLAGDFFRFLDIASGLWLVEGQITQSGGSEATPFSATVS